MFYLSRQTFQTYIMYLVGDNRRLQIFGSVFFFSFLLLLLLLWLGQARLWWHRQREGYTAGLVPVTINSWLVVVLIRLFVCSFAGWLDWLVGFFPARFFGKSVPRALSGGRQKKNKENVLVVCSYLVESVCVYFT